MNDGDASDPGAGGTDTSGTTADSTDATDARTRLAAYRFADSFLPVGGNTVSYGLEQFVQSGAVADGDDLREVLESYLRRQVGPCETVAIRAAHAAADDLDAVRDVDETVRATTLAAEFRESATKAGRRLLEVEAETGGDPVVAAYEERVASGDAPGNYPVALGLVAARRGIDAGEACLVHAHSFLTDMLGAAQRLLSLGHVTAQRVLDDLAPVAAAVVAANEDRDIERMEAFAPLVDVHAMEHERADRRLFLS
ncbi:urease accessory protein UreF [Halarchaeum nitratireducens]|uniref:Urease accessory protein UreF n=1 Tax=Halarchaeum nitratireducens TaxID=489913 RepID=A0A830G845_9EURY|nr:urease accessory UreF family protein [Halarchaeum nitratireducens]GGN10851.1 urease accessory protein UreF [Halarchaeum nitratireducens]